MKITDLTRPIIGIENRTAQEVFEIMRDRITAALSASPAVGVKVLTAGQLCRTPLIEWLVPTTEEWDACETMQDRYDLMKRRVQMAFTDAALTTEGSEG